VGKRQATAAGAINSCRCGARDAAEQLQPHVQLARDVPDALQLRDPAAVDEHVADDTAAARCVCPIGCQLAHRRSPYARRASRGPGRLRGGADASAHSVYLAQRTNAIGRDDQPGMRPSCVWLPGVAGVDDWRSSESVCDVCQPRGQPSDRSCRGNVVLSRPQPLGNAQCGRFAQASCSLSRHVTLFNRAA
jgi:hypothetical protein